MLRQFDRVLVELQLLDANVRLSVLLADHFTLLSLVLQVLHARVLRQSYLAILLLTLLFEGEALAIPALLVDCLLVAHFVRHLSDSVEFVLHLQLFVFVLLFEPLEEV